MKMFARITKVDEERREVTGRAAQETVDRDGEVFDFASSVPNFQRWSAECYADSGGKSRGNIRAMHGSVAAGIVKNIDFNQIEKAIDITAQITDDAEWKKILTGTYQGFSIGGRYSRKWTDISGGKPVVRYTAMPSEISVVDRPSCPSALFFDIHKRDGSIIRKSFRSAALMTNDLQKSIRQNVPALAAIYEIHAAGATPEDPIGRERVLQMRKRNVGTQKVDRSELARSIRHMRKVGGVNLPPQSNNAQWDDVRSDDGAVRASDRNYRDDDDCDDEDCDDMTLAVGVSNTFGSPAMRAATLSAIKSAMRNPKRMG